MFALIWTNFKRDKGRKVLTLLSLLVAFLLFGMLMALRHAMTYNGPGPVAARQLVTRSTAGMMAPMPVAYAERIARVPGVDAVSYVSGTVGMYQQPDNVFMFLGVPAPQIFETAPDLKIAQQQRQAWMQDRAGALVSPKLMQLFHWKIGDRIPVQTPIQKLDGSSTWHVTIDGVVTSSSMNAVGMQQMLVHYDYLDQARASGRGTVFSISELVNDAKDAGPISQSIDQLFINAAPQTQTSPVQAVFRNVFAQVGNISLIITDVALAVFFSMLLIVGAVLLHSARERSSEFAVLRALGFRRLAVTGIVFGEALLVCVIGGISGLILAGVLTHSLGRSLNQILALMTLTPDIWLLAVGLIVLFAALVSVLPVLQLWHLSIRDTLGRI